MMTDQAPIGSLADILRFPPSPYEPDRSDLLILLAAHPALPSNIELASGAAPLPLGLQDGPPVIPAPSSALPVAIGAILLARRRRATRAGRPR